ncbi:MAG: phytanoyl-CoA dioxygenase family protein [Hyphomicrobiales bacterium]|nr:phytanoyl-CoA dioxygenase family protein [Hyphomicrobiales bacterium]
MQGTERFYTAWIPLGDCGGDLGGLQVAAGSHANGVLPLHPAMGAGGMEVPGDYSDQWLANDMAAGDVLLFNALTVHAGRPNLSDRMRLSIDLRYQPLSEPISEEWLHPHRRKFTWDQLYADLDDDTWQYYWRDRDLTVVPFDRRYYEARDRLSFEIAAAGDRRAEATLKRIADRDPDPEKRARAIAALRALESA